MFGYPSVELVLRDEDQRLFEFRFVPLVPGSADGIYCLRTQTQEFAAQVMVEG